MSKATEELTKFHKTINFGSREALNEAQGRARQTYLSLDPTEIEELARFAISSISEGDFHAHEMLLCLACFCPGGLRQFHKALVQNRIFYPPVIYCGADSALVKELLEVLPEKEYVNHALSAMAWVGNQEVQQEFSAWQNRPPSWASDLHVPPHDYATEAGWELMPDGKRRDLFYEQCHPLILPKEKDAEKSIVKVNLEHEGKCPWCGQSLTVVFDFDLTDGAIAFLGIRGSKLRVATCEFCTCYGIVFTRVDWYGGAEWYEGNQRPTYLPTDSSDCGHLSSQPLAFCSRPRHHLQAANWLLPGVAFSQVGGIPTWIQDAEYPACPECEQKMTCVGQLSNEDYQEFGEGIFYTFLCKACMIAATHYQQT